MSRARIGRDRALDTEASGRRQFRAQERQPSSDLAAGERNEQDHSTPGKIPLQLTKRGFVPFPRLRLSVVRVLSLKKEADGVIDRRSKHRFWAAIEHGNTFRPACRDVSQR